MKTGKHRFKGVCTVAVCLLAGGCANVPVHQQRLVAKPNMTFSDSLVFNYSNSLQHQVEPGSATLGGATSSGCTSCK
jgi:hypothetical protein